MVSEQIKTTVKVTFWRWLPKQAVTGLMFGLVGGLLALLIARVTYPPPTFIALDLATLVGEQVQNLATRQDIGDAAKAQLSTAFAWQLDLQAKAMAADYHAIVLVAPAVVTGVPDLTAELRQRVQTALAAQGLQGVQSGGLPVAVPQPAAQQPPPEGLKP